MLIILKLSKCCSANNISESLAESAAAYTKATARKCLLAKVEVITGEEAESNVLQVRNRENSEELWVRGGSYGCAVNAHRLIPFNPAIPYFSNVLSCVKMQTLDIYYQILTLLFLNFLFLDKF